jgi:DNA recombination protein Rad52
MSFQNEQLDMLNAPLNRNNVRQREQGRTTVSYIEGWHAIAEANRIFGFDGWTRETVDINCVAENPRKIGEGKAWEKDGFGVTYTAKVKVTAGGVVREGVGAGHGIDADPGQAHESAIKEAETDAMKRALMTFGNPFGLALYDKEKSNVKTDAEINAPAPATKDEICAALGACTSRDELVATWKAHAQRLNQMQRDAPDDYHACVEKKDEMKADPLIAGDIEREAIQGEAA